MTTMKNQEVHRPALKLFRLLGWISVLMAFAQESHTYCSLQQRVDIQFDVT